MNNDNVAFTISGGYSDKHNGQNEQNDGTLVIKKEDLKQLNNPDCKHPNMQKDESDKIGDTVAWKCPDCNRGAFLPNTVTKIT